MRSGAGLGEWRSPRSPSLAADIYDFVIFIICNWLVCVLVIHSRARWKVEMEIWKWHRRIKRFSLCRAGAVNKFRGWNFSIGGINQARFKFFFHPQTFLLRHRSNHHCRSRPVADEWKLLILKKRESWIMVLMLEPSWCSRISSKTTIEDVGRHRRDKRNH